MPYWNVEVIKNAVQKFNAFTVTCSGLFHLRIPASGLFHLRVSASVSRSALSTALPWPEYQLSNLPTIWHHFLPTPCHLVGAPEGGLGWPRAVSDWPWVVRCWVPGLMSGKSHLEEWITPFHYGTWQASGNDARFAATRKESGALKLV